MECTLSLGEEKAEEAQDQHAEQRGLAARPLHWEVLVEPADSALSVRCLSDESP